MTGEELDIDNAKVNHQGTSASYESLISGHCDIIIAQQASPEIEKKIKKIGHIETVARDGLVFIASKKNPVEKLTIKQLQGIFSGGIKNWRQVGGPSSKVITVQRNEAGGSQILIEKYVMKGLAMKKVPEYLRPGNMSAMSSAVEEYDRGGHTIGYSTFYYVDSFDVREGLKMLAVNGVKPSVESISDGSYPIISNIYVAIRKDASKEAKQLYEWLLSDEGQEVVAKSGYPVVK